MVGVGASAVFLMVLLVPAVIVGGHFHDIFGPLLAIGVPVVVISAATGALVGASPSGKAAVDGTEQTEELSATVRVLLATVIISMAIILVWSLLPAAGVVNGVPLGFG